MNHMLDTMFSSPEDEEEYWENQDAYYDYLADKADNERDID